jgi:hypothetical protein
MRIVPPEMKALTEEDGTPVLDENNEQVMVPDTDNWSRQMEQVELETLVFVDQGDPNNPTVFKLAVDKEFLGKILAYYVQFLDTDGRIELREALSKASGISEATISDISQLKLVD